jgi:hypothetical protein
MFSCVDLFWHPCRITDGPVRVELQRTLLTDVPGIKFGVKADAFSNDDDSPVKGVCGSTATSSPLNAYAVFRTQRTAAAYAFLLLAVLPFAACSCMPVKFTTLHCLRWRQDTPTCA